MYRHWSLLTPSSGSGLFKGNYLTWTIRTVSQCCYWLVNEGVNLQGSTMNISSISRFLPRQTTVFSKGFCSKPSFYYRAPTVTEKFNIARVSIFDAQPKSFPCSPVKFSTLASKAPYPSSCIGSLKLLGLFERKHQQPVKQYIREMSSKFDIKELTKALVDEMKNVKQAPYPALVLGMSGLVPFGFPPFYMLFAGFGSSLAFAQAAYGACILSFLGGVRWGYVLPELSEEKLDWINLGSSVVPPLVGWMALLMPLSLCQLILIGGLSGAAYYDMKMKCYPPWFKGLRIMLSCGAVSSICLVFLFSFIFRSKDRKKCVKVEGEK